MPTNLTPLPLNPQMPALRLEVATLRNILHGIVECSPWVIDKAVLAPPYESEEGLWQAIIEPIRQAPYSAQIALLDAHPELAGAQAMAGTMTQDSTTEQARLGLLQLTPDEFQRLQGINRRYRERFGFPFIVALRLFQDLPSLLDAGEQRLKNDPVTELQVALGQVYEVIRGRLNLRLTQYRSDRYPASEPAPPTSSPRRP